MLKSFYPVLLVEDVQASKQFYVDRYNFTVTYDSDWYVSLRHVSGFELAFVRYDHETVPEEMRQPTANVILNFEFDSDSDVAVRYADLDIPVLLPFKNEDFGQRHFIAQDPVNSRVMLDEIEEIPPSAEFIDNYQDGYAA